MKKFGFVASALMLASSSLLAANMAIFDPKSVDHIEIKVDLLGQDKNTPVGSVIAVKTNYGVAFFPDLKGLEPGLHGFHVHANPDCGATDKGLGMKAGGHWDPANSGNHSFPWDDKGHKGDLPAIYVASDGTATNPVLSPKIKDLSELKGHSLMVHIGGDNHSDHPKALGGGGARMACGVIK